MKIHVTDLISGDTLSSDAFNYYGLHVLSKNTVMNSETISTLYRHNIDYVEIQFRPTDVTINEEITRNPDFSEQIHNSYLDAVSDIKGLFEKTAQDGKLDSDEIEACFEPLANGISNEKDVVSLLLSLNNKDDYTYQHSVQVGMISYFLSKWMNHSEEQNLLIGKAGYLHDIGKSQISMDVLKKPARLTDEEYNEIKRHPEFGYKIINRSLNSVDSILALVALQHHERLDGKGYPNKLIDAQIHPVSRIIAVADIYSAMISSRVYQRKRDLLTVMKELYKLSFGELDPHIVQVFILNMVPNFVGKKVLLNTGETGIIIHTNPADLFRPLIQMGSEFVDLSRSAEYSIETIDI